ncbi:MAG: alanine--tRNA ligase [Acutalibacteraceae bacterium]
MQWTGLNELRESFLAFFEDKGHLRLPSASLIPHNDKSLLLINAGMAPLKKYFTGELTPPGERCVSCQKCIRTPDIERVGKTSRHGTYFEMLGNFSFGDYFKREAIFWAWEYLTRVLEIPTDKLYVSVFTEDDEAYDIWTKEILIPPSHIVRLGREDNFWEHGAGPCGPCSEIHYDRGEKYGCGSSDCTIGCDCDRYVEVWNLVFTQFENDGNNNYTRLKNPNIDTGMGLERLACVIQEKDNIFEVDTIQNIIKQVCLIAGVTYGKSEKTDVSLRVITDHIRSTVFMTADGVIPSNVGRGYVLRRLIRRAARHGRLIGIDSPFLARLVKTVVNENKGAYPALVEKEDYIVKIISLEEESFSKTIDSGLCVLGDMIDNTTGPVLSGADAFKLQDTFGFPLDLTKEILAEKNMYVDEAEFCVLLENARQTARAARKDAGTEAWKTSELDLRHIDPTQFVGYTEYTSRSKILSIIAQGELAGSLAAENHGIIITDTTPFYALSGGQTSDTGTIKSGECVFEVTSVTKTSDGIWLHHGTLVSGKAISVGDDAKCEINIKKRLATRRNHTAAHLLQAALRKLLGTHVAQAGSFVSPEVMRFDFSHFNALTDEEISSVENLVNRYILSAAPVTVTVTDAESARKSGALALFGEKYSSSVRVVRCGDFSVELCGGTHAENTGELGLFKIVSESSVAAGVRRIEGLTGFNSLEYIRNRESLIHNTALALKAGNSDIIAEKAASLLSDLKCAEKEISALKGEIAKAKSADILSDFKEIKGVKLYVADFGEADFSAARAVCDAIKDKGEDAVILIGAKDGDKGTLSFACSCGASAVKKGAHAGILVREVAKITEGSGGGKPESAMAGGKNPEKLPQALASAEKILADLLKD